MQLHLHLLPLLFATVWCQDENVISPIKGIATMLNISKENLDLIANNFVFKKDLPRESVTFYYFTPGINSTVATPITEQNATQLLDLTKSVKVIVHGYMDSGRAQWMFMLASAYHLAQDCNVISIDWSRLAFGNYVASASSVRGVGEIAAGFLLAVGGGDARFLRRVHLVGHSLGAHVSGFAGKALRRRGLAVGRITGMDAAGPLFDTPFPRGYDSKLAKSDAEFVDAIHSDDHIIGASGPHGVADFYVNGGGPIQPTCNSFNGVEAVFCSHIMSIFYMYLTILTPTLMEAQSCPTWDLYKLHLCRHHDKINMGEYVPLDAKGPYYLKTF